MAYTRPRRPLRAHFTRNRVLEAAGNVFAAKGIEGTRIDDILEAANISRRTFYKYFRSKEEVLSGLFGVMSALVLEALAGGNVTDDHHPLAAVRRTLDSYLDFHANAGPLLRLLTVEAMRPESPLAPLRHQFQSHIIAVVDAALGASGRPSPHPYTYRALLGAIEAVSLALLSSSARAEDVAQAKQILWTLVDRVLLDAPR
jgi:AcrR family transcriptional regulator